MEKRDLPDTIERPGRKLRALAELLSVHCEQVGIAPDMVGISYLIEDMVDEIAIAVEKTDAK